jgi:hypothetical protein
MLREATDRASVGRSRQPAWASWLVILSSVTPLWADFVIAGLVFLAVLLPLEYGGTSAVLLAAVVAGALLVLLLAHRWQRRI